MNALGFFANNIPQPAPVVIYAAGCEDCEFSVETKNEEAVREVVAGHARRRGHESFYVVLQEGK